MTKTLSLEDFILPYPNRENPDFQKDISSRLELSTLYSPLDETITEGELYNHQLFAERFIAHANSVLLIDEPGTGKTCKFIAFAEYARKQHAKMLEDPTNPEVSDMRNSHFRGCMVITAKTGVTEFINQLVYNCTTRYKNLLEARAQPGSQAWVRRRVREKNLGRKITAEGLEKGTKAAMTRMTEDWYSVSSYMKFFLDKTKDLKSKDPAERAKVWVTLLEEYSNTIFFIDEAHHLGIREEELEKQRLLVNLSALDTDIGEVDIYAAEKQKYQIYFFYYILRRIVRNSKFILATGTPASNYPSDARAVFDLVLSEELPDNFSFEDSSLEEFDRYLRGTVLYVRASDTDAKAKEISKEIYEVEPRITMYQLEMSEFQTQAYIHSLENASGIYTEQSHASNFVFPDGNYGTGKPEEQREYERNVRELRKKGAEQKREEALEREKKKKLKGEAITRKTTKNVDITGRIHGKGGRFVNKERPQMPGGDTAFARYFTKSGPKQEWKDYFKKFGKKGHKEEVLEELKTLGIKYGTTVEMCDNAPGCCLIYTERVEAGVVTIAGCFDVIGYSAFAGETTQKKRYAIIKGEGMKSKEVRDILDVFNSEENWDGSIIKVLMITEVGREILNIFHIQDEFIIEQDWNPSNTYQAIRRGLRAGSHKILLKKLQEKNKDLEFVEVRIYKLAAVPNPDTLQDSGIDPDDLDWNDETSIINIAGIDIAKGILVYKKNIEIHKMMRKLKQIAVDCNVQLKRNIRPADKNNTEDCDYQLCKYECFEQPGNSNISYLLYYPNLYYKKLIPYIYDAFHEQNSYNVNTLNSKLSESGFQVDDIEILFALAYIINSKKRLTDRYGFPIYLHEDLGTFYTSPIYYAKKHLDLAYMSSFYSQFLIAVENKSLDVVIEEIYKDDYNRILEDIENTGGYEIEQINFQEELKDYEPSPGHEGRLFLAPEPKELTEEELEQTLIMKTKIDEISIELRGKLLERYFERLFNGVPLKTDYIIGDRLGKYLFFMHEPVKEQKEKRERVEKKVRKRGRPPLEPGKKQTKLRPEAIENLEYDTDTEIVFFHILFTQITGRTTYSITSRLQKAEGRLRLFKPSEGIGWRDMNNYELNAYSKFTQAFLLKQFGFIRDHAVKLLGKENAFYGSLLEDNELRILDIRKEKVSKKQDLRTLRKGKKCISFESHDIINFLYLLHAPEPEAPEESMKEMRAYALAAGKGIENWPDDEIKYYYSWRESNAILCDELQRIMSENRLIWF